MTKYEIKALAIRCGFKLREQPDGTLDLNPYAYDFVDRLLKTQSDKMRADEIKSLPMERGAVQIDTGYVYADQLLKAHLDQLISEGWRQCAKGQNTTQFCGQLEATLKAERQRQRDKIEAHIGRTTMSIYGTQPECKAARDALQRLLEDDK